MENKVAFFTEGPWTGYISKSSLGRTDMNWLFVQNAYHISISDVKRNKYLYKKQFDIGIYIIPKNNPNLSLDTLNDLKSMCSKIGIMQESDQIAWQRYSVDNQINYLHFVSE